MATDVCQMPGIRLYGSPFPRTRGRDAMAGASVPHGSLFSLLFRSILPELSKHRWFFPGGFETFNVPANWYDREPGQTKFVQMSRLLTPLHGRHGFEYCFAETSTAIEAWLPYIEDDWNEIYVFDDNRLSRDEIVRIEGEQSVPINAPPAALAAWAEALFYSYEGCYWSCYSWRPSLLDAVKADVLASWPGARLTTWQELSRRRTSLEIVECTLSETQRLHQA